MKILLIGVLFFLNLPAVFSQRVEVPTSKKEAEKLLKQDRIDSQRSKQYFDADEKCRNLIRARKFIEAESVCRNAVSLAEKLPKDRYLEKSVAYELLAVVLIRQARAGEAIPLLNQSLEAAKPVIDDTDAETGERYFWLGQANHQLGKINEAREYYTKAENSYRTAFKEMGDSDIREFYPQPIVNILEAHLILLKDAGLKEEAAKIEKRLVETKVEFAKFLEN
ncbi:MAG TPA: tetratricopeptide repeat protein [Pyrinomonadaceae bacterium]|nr:tetratricopeptide repeat protein [Pyrinomonadaceae bacterium]